MRTDSNEVSQMEINIIRSSPRLSNMSIADCIAQMHHDSEWARYYIAHGNPAKAQKYAARAAEIGAQLINNLDVLVTKERRSVA